MISYIAQGIGLGFAGAAQPGPFQAYIISQTLKNGWRPTLVASLAPLVSDGPIIALVLLVLSQLPESMRNVMHIASGLFLLWLAWSAFCKWRKMSEGEAAPPESGGRTLLKATFMNLINPMPYVYWGLVTGPILLSGWEEAPIIGIGFLAGFYGALVSTLAGVILLFGLARQFGYKVTHALLGVSVMALAGFGFYQLWLGLF